MDLKERAEGTETPEPRPERSVVPRVPEPTPGQRGGLQGFAVAMAGDIVRSCLSRRGGGPPRSGGRATVERMAEELAAVSIRAALREARPGGRERSPGEFRRPSAPGSPDVRGPAGEGEPGAEGNALPGRSSAFRTSRDPRAPLPGVPQSGLPALGSLDYPDAPPTTPLLPEMMRSRDSFSRQLKGGLAKEFLPSPPPPTPKDRREEEEDEEGGRETKVEDGRAEFVGRLLRSLSLECSERVEDVWKKEEELSAGFRGEAPPGRGAEPGAGARIAAYAESLADDIIGWITRGAVAAAEPRSREEGRREEDIGLLANQMAESVVMASLKEVKMAV